MLQILNEKKKRKGFLPHTQTSKPHANFHIRADSQEPLMFIDKLAVRT